MHQFVDCFHAHTLLAHCDRSSPHSRPHSARTAQPAIAHALSPTPMSAAATAIRPCWSAATGTVPLAGLTCLLPACRACRVRSDETKLAYAGVLCFLFA